MSAQPVDVLGLLNRVAGREVASAEAWKAYDAILALKIEVEWVSSDIAKWFGDGIKPDEWKLHEWHQRLDAALARIGGAP